jgi:hypothetical protein
LNKFVGNSWAKGVFNIQDGSIGFPEFVDLVSQKDSNCSDPRGLHACTDPHWKPQMMTCGLDHLLPHFDFIGSFEHISEHTKLLLQRVALWERYGQNFDDGNDLKKNQNHADRCTAAPLPVRDKNYTAPGFNQRGPSGTNRFSHTTGSQSLLHSYYSPELLAKVREAYALDYAIWDDLKRRPASEVASGSDLQSVQGYCQGRS